MRITITCTLLWLLLFGLAPSLFLVHHDLGWHLRAGELITASGSVPTTDPWSFTANGYPWFNLSWMWDIGSWLLFSTGGLGALVVAGIALGAVCFGLGAAMASVAGAEGISILFTSLLAGCALLTYEPPDNPLAISPQAFSLFLLALVNLIYLHPGWSTRKKLLCAAGIQLLWANTHGGFPAGWVAAGTFVLCNWKVLQSERSFGSILGLLGILFAPLCTPLGFRIWEAVLRSVDHPSVPFITEWNAFRWSDSLLMSALIAGFLLSLSIFKNRGIRALLIQGLFWLVLGLQHQRHLSLFVILAMPPVALFLSPFVRRLNVTNHLSTALAKPIGGRFYLALALSCVLLPFLVRYRMNGKIDWAPEMDPKAEIAFLLQHHPGERIFNEWNFGAFIILHAAGRIPVFIDGRAGTAYPPQLFDDYVNKYLSPSGNWNQLLDEYQLDLALVARYRLRALEFFRKQQCWQKIFEGTAAVIFERRNSPDCRRGIGLNEAGGIPDNQHQAPQPEPDGRSLEGGAQLPISFRY